VIDPLTPTTLYAGTDEGIFESTNGGSNWLLFDVGLPDIDIYALAIDSTNPTTLFAGTFSNGVIAIQP
jgi:hypothetical protein